MRDLRELAEPDRILLWDLDGTIVDTSRDIAAGVAGALSDLGLSLLSTHQVIQNVGQGVRELMRKCLTAVGQPSSSDEQLSLAIDLFRSHYAVHLMDTTRPYADLDRVLLDLHSRGRRMAVISNKPAEFTREILERLGLCPCFRVILGGDSLSSRKPSPEPLLYALGRCDPSALPGAAAVIGDSLVDAESARSAGIPICGVAWGFDLDGGLRRAQPDWWVERPEKLGAILTGAPG